MAARKTLRELTIKNNFMFGAVMCDEENRHGIITVRLTWSFY